MQGNADSLVPIAISARYRAAKVELKAKSLKARNLMSISVGGRRLLAGKLAGKREIGYLERSRVLLRCTTVTMLQAYLRQSQSSLVSSLTTHLHYSYTRVFVIRPRYVFNCLACHLNSLVY